MTSMSSASIAAAVVGIAALFLILLGAAGLGRPEAAKGFFGGFATSVGKHWLEIGIRMLIGWALIVHAPASAAPSVLLILGWVLVITSAILAILPWRWHQDFASKSVASAMRHVTLLSIASIAMGLLLSWAALAGTT